jgi:hypothetical protein
MAAPAPFTERPPQLLQPGVSRFDAAGRPTQAQVEYENRLQQYLTRLVAGLSAMQAKTFANALPAADPHVVGEVWSNAGALTVSAG